MRSRCHSIFASKQVHQLDDGFISASLCHQTQYHVRFTFGERRPPRTRHFPSTWHWRYQDLSVCEWSRSEGGISWTFGCCYWHNYILKLPFCSSTRTTWLYHASLFCKDAPWNLDSMSIVLIMSLFPFPISIGQGLSMEILKNLYPLMHFHLLERTLFLPVMLMLTYVMIVQQETLSHEYHTWSIRLWFTSSQRSNPHRDCLLRSEYMAARMATEKIIEFWTTLHYLWIPIKSASYLFGDNKTVVDISLNLDSKLNKRHVLISYHRWGRQ